MRYPLTIPFINDEIRKSVLSVLDSGFLTEGPVTQEFAQKFTEYIGCKWSIPVTSCTTGLELALRAIGLGAGDEVIVPDYTYPATASVVHIVGATAVLVDIHRDSMLIDYDALEDAITDKTRAVIPVSLFGNPLDYNRLNKIKDKYGLIIIEDAACSVGALFDGKKVGNWSDISVFSFHPRKFITTGEGGMITTNHTEWAAWMDSYKHFGMQKSTERGDSLFEILGTNYKLSNIQSAIGLEQLKIIDTLLERRINLAENYQKLLKNVEGISIPSVHPLGRPSFQSYCVFVNDRDEIMHTMRQKGIEVQIGTYALHMHNAFKGNSPVRISGNMEHSRWAYEHCMVLPMYHELTHADQKLIIEELINQVNN